MSSGLSAKIFAKVVAAGGNPRQIAALQAAGVPRTPEFNRILALPRREPPSGAADRNGVVARMKGHPTEWEEATEHFRTPGGTMVLRPLQAAALIEASQCQGCFAPLGVGEGKTLVSLLLPEALGSTVAVLLLPPTMKAQLFKELSYYGGHFRLPKIYDADGTAQFPGDYSGTLVVVAYSELSGQKKAEILEALRPDLVIADEAHNLRRADAARTRRFLRYMRANSVRFVAMSGTMTSKSILDYAHLADLCLGAGSPVPRTAFYRDSQAWAAALDPGGQGAPGALELLHTAPHNPVFAEDIRHAFYRRLVETPGVIASQYSTVGASLIIRLRRPTVPKVVQDALATLATTWAWDGDELTDAMTVARIARQLSAGYFLRWKWHTPDGKPDPAGRAWLEARNGLSRAIRYLLQRHSRPGFDSPGLVIAALQSGGAGLPEWEAWRPHMDLPVPPTEVVWLDDFLVKDAAAWAGVYKEGIIWAHDPWLGKAIATAAGLPWFGAGTDRALTQVTPERFPILVASARAHGTGKNLQGWSRNYVATPMSGADAWQQLIGRTHRPGQLADEVEVFVNVHTPALAQAWEQAREKAAYIQATMGDRQRILYASVID